MCIYMYTFTYISMYIHIHLAASTEGRRREAAENGNLAGILACAPCCSCIEAKLARGGAARLLKTPASLMRSIRFRAGLTLA